MNRAALITHARTSIARGSKSFAMASRLFDRETRERAWLLYAWCRACDDIADGQEHGGALSRVGDAQARLDEIREKTRAALGGQATGDPAFDGLGMVAAETAMPHRYADDLIEGFALDAAEWRPQTADDLMRYCYHVAGSVGCMMAVVMGVRPDDEGVLDRACDLGLAFQLDTRNNHAFSAETIGAVIGHADWRVECLLFGFIRLGSGHFHPGLCLPDASIPLLLVVRGRSGGRSCRPDWQA